MSVLYLVGLLVVIGCMVLLDRRFRLAFWRDRRRAWITLGFGLILLLTIDLIGIALGVFFRAPTKIMTGILLAPELPLEEPVFLAFLLYLTINLIGIFERVLPKRRPQT